MNIIKKNKIEIINIFIDLNMLCMIDSLAIDFIVDVTFKRCNIFPLQLFLSQKKHLQYDCLLLLKHCFVFNAEHSSDRLQSLCMLVIFDLSIQIKMIR